MRIDEDGWNLHQRSESHRRFHVIGEVEERTSERPDFRDRHAIQRRCHPVFADTEMEIAPAVAPRLEIACAFKLRSEEHTSELQSQSNLVCRLLLEKKNSIFIYIH